MRWPMGGAFFVEGLMYLAHPLLGHFVEVLLGGRLGDFKEINGLVRG